MMYTAQLPDKGPFVIRYPRGNGSMQHWQTPLKEVEIGKGSCLIEGNQIAVITIGTAAIAAEKAIGKCPENSIALYDIRFLKPLDEELLHTIFRKFTKVMTIEDGTVTGGLGSAVLEFMADHAYTPTIKRIGIPDKFVQHGTIPELYQLCGMDEDSITKELLKQCELLPSMSKIKELTN